MWIIVSENRVLKSPRPITLNGIRHPKEIFRNWSIDDLMNIGIKHFREESYDSFKYNSTGFTDVDNGEEIVRTHTLIENKEYLNRLKEKKITQIKSSMEQELLQGTIVIINEKEYKMNCTELDIIKLKNGINLAESNDETKIEIIDYDNNVYSNIPINIANTILKQIGLYWRTLNRKRITLRNQIMNASSEEELLSIDW